MTKSAIPSLSTASRFEWCGRQLERMTDGDNTLFYAISTVDRESEVLKMASKLGYVGD